MKAFCLTTLACLGLLALGFHLYVQKQNGMNSRVCRLELKAYEYCINNDGGGCDELLSPLCSDIYPM